MRLRILSYNIHKGIGSGLRDQKKLPLIRDALHEIQPDIALLQEVTYRHKGPTHSQTEFLAKGLWPHFTYGKNDIYSRGHHGNAVLSKFPILSSENIDISSSRIERRGILHTTLQIPQLKNPLHILCTHLGLFEFDRKVQIETLSKRILAHTDDNGPLIMGGDFNDWREKSTDRLAKSTGLNEIFVTLTKAHAKTFPVWMPVLRLDRIYFRGVKAVSATRLTSSPWNTLSDHAAILAAFDLA